MNKTRVICRIKEYIYDDVSKLFYKERRDGFFVFTANREESINVKKYWLFKYILLYIIEKNKKVSHLRIRKFLEYEPPKYHCF
jgi:hypothetical protein